MAPDSDKLEVERPRRIQAGLQRVVACTLRAADRALRNVVDLAAVVDVLASDGFVALLCGALEQLRKERVARRRREKSVVDRDAASDAAPRPVKPYHLAQRPHEAHLDVEVDATEQV